MHQKTKRHTNPQLLAMARDKPCLVNIPWVCNHDPATVVAAHSNWHDKGMGRKASDYWTVWACSACHTWLDQGKASGEDKKRAFEAAHVRQVAQWQASAHPAAKWALEHLREIG